MRYSPVIEFDAPHSSLTVNGISSTCSPYAIIVEGPQAFVWATILRRTKYRNQFIGLRPEREPKK